MPDVEHLGVGHEALLGVLLHRCPEDVVGLTPLGNVSAMPPVHGVPPLTHRLAAPHFERLAVRIQVRVHDLGDNVLAQLLLEALHIKVGVERFDAPDHARRLVFLEQ